MAIGPSRVNVIRSEHDAVTGPHSIEHQLSPVFCALREAARHVHGSEMVCAADAKISEVPQMTVDDVALPGTMHVLEFKYVGDRVQPRIDVERVDGDLLQRSRKESTRLCGAAVAEGSALLVNDNLHLLLAVEYRHEDRRLVAIGHDPATRSELNRTATQLVRDHPRINASGVFQAD